MLLEHFDPRGIFALPDQSSHVYVIFALEMPQAQRRPVDRPSVHAVETEFMTQSRGANAWLPFEILQSLSEGGHQPGGHFGAGFLAVVPDLVSPIFSCLWAQGYGFTRYRHGPSL